MDMRLLVVFQTLALPLALSFVLLCLTPRSDWQNTLGLLLIWLPSYAWIIGLPSVPPLEAVDWLWLLGLMMTMTPIINRPFRRQMVQTFVLLMGLVALTWPVLRYQLTVVLSIELIITGAAGGVLLHRLNRAPPASPALTMATSAGGLAVASALAGSLLIGQLAAALAAVTGGFALYELIKRSRETRFSMQQTALTWVIYLGLLTIARVYAELPLGPAVLLGASPLTGLLLPWRYGWFTSLLLAGIALAWIVLNNSTTSAG